MLVRVAVSAPGLDLFGSMELTAPTAVRDEALSALHEAAWRKQLSVEAARTARDRILGAPIRLVADKALLLAAWDIADQLGMAKLYDSRYLALARREGVPLFTDDLRLARAAEGLIEVRTSADLA